MGIIESAGEIINTIKETIVDFYNYISAVFSFIPSPFSGVLMTAVFVILAVIIARLLGVLK